MVRRIALFVATGTLTASGAVWAGTKPHSVDVTLTTLTLVSGQRVPAGDYRLSWDGDSSPVQVAFERGSKVVAKVDAKIEPRSESSEGEELISRTRKDGTRALEEVRLPKEKAALVFAVS